MKIEKTKDGKFNCIEAVVLGRKDILFRLETAERRRTDAIKAIEELDKEIANLKVVLGD